MGRGEAVAGNLTASQNILAQNLLLNPVESLHDIQSMWNSTDYFKTRSRCAAELVQSPVFFLCLVKRKGQTPGASISLTKPFCILSMAERVTVMIVQLVRMHLVISVEPDWFRC